MRSARRELREKLLNALSTGKGSLPELVRVADGLFSREVGYGILLNSFLANEVSQGLAKLRIDGAAESVGKIWKLANELDGDDVDKISLRRLKRLRGEFKAQILLDHNFGRTENAVAVARMLEIIEQQLPKEDAVALDEVATD